MFVLSGFAIIIDCEHPLTLVPLLICRIFAEGSTSCIDILCAVPVPIFLILISKLMFWSLDAFGLFGVFCIVKFGLFTVTVVCPGLSVCWVVPFGKS